jgi:hypothetical protein
MQHIKTQNCDWSTPKRPGPCSLGMSCKRSLRIWWQRNPELLECCDMIKVYDIWQHGGALVDTTGTDFWDFMMLALHGEAMLPTWKTCDFDVDDAGGQSPILNFCTGPLGAGVFGVLPGALKHPRIVSFLEQYGELLPITVRGKGAKLFNSFRFLDCLDEERTKFDALELREGRRRTNSPVFRSSALVGASFFRIREYPAPIYLAEPDTGGFKALYDELKLRGLEFHEVRVTQDL